MDPYLEDPVEWPDFHNTFINYWREAIADALPRNYVAKLDEHVQLVEVDPEHAKRIRPDVTIARWDETGGTSSSGTAAVATLAPVTIPLVYDEPARQTYIEIRRRPERELVAVLELLSPSNKHDPGLGEYLAKRYSILRQGVHLLELDLLLAGERMPLKGPLPPGDYYALLARADRRPDCDVYAWTLRDPLPTLPIPLRAPDPDVRVDLAAVFRTAYERGRYAQSIRYDEPPPTVTNPRAREWILETVRKAK